MIFETYSALETEQVAYDISKNTNKGDIFCLNGDLGVGKTVFAKGFAKGLDILENITSPTFNLINVYNGKLNLYHFDVYRINHVSEMGDTGYEEYFYGDGVCLVEWAELIKEIVPKNSFSITIEKDYEKDENYRKIIVEKV